MLNTLMETRETRVSYSRAQNLLAEALNVITQARYHTTDSMS